MKIENNFSITSSVFMQNKPNYCPKLLFLLSISLLFSLSSCKKPVPNFSINGFKDVQSMPGNNFTGDLTNPQQIITVQVNEPVVLEDLSMPGDKVKHRNWDFDGDGIVDNDVENNRSVSCQYEGAGLYKINLCINGAEICTGKWIHVVDPTPPPVDSSTLVVVEKTPEVQAPPPPVISPKPKTRKSSSGPSPEPFYVKPKPVESPIIHEDKPAPVEAPKSTPSNLRTNNASVGMALTSHAAGCGVFQQNSFTASLTPSRNVLLSSFRLFSDGCGGVNVSLSGGDLDESFKAALVNGKNNIAFDDDIELTAGVTYSLQCRAISNYAGCKEPNPPHFENASACGNAISNAILRLDSQGNSFIYELKFRY